MDLIIRNATLRGSDKLMAIGIEGEKIRAIGPELPVKGRREIDAQGQLCAPAFVDPHIHLDKVNIVDVVRPNISGTLTEAIEIIWEKKARYTTDDIVTRAGAVVRIAAVNGTTVLRSHVDVDTIGGLKPLQGVLATKEKLADVADLQIVAFPQEGILKDPGCRELMWEAMRQGADVVGGMPANEATPDDSREHIRLAFDIAEHFDAPVDMHVDETDDPFYRTLEMLADETIRRGYQGRVTAGHTCALAAYDDHYAKYVMEKISQAGIHMITNPVTNLLLQGRNDKQPVRRGITRVKELLARGVNVSCGQDCIKDTFYPFGAADMLQVAMITAHAAHLSLPHEREQVFDMITVNAAKVLGLADYGLAEGMRADLVIIGAGNVTDAIRLLPARRLVIRKGQIIAQTECKQELLV